MGKQLGRVVLKFVPQAGMPAVTLPYVISSDSYSDGWDIRARRADAKTFASVCEAAAWVDALPDESGPRTYCHLAMRLAFTRIVRKKATR